MIAKESLSIVLLLSACGIVGCNSAAREQELQQQKLLTELAKTNTETLAAIEKRQAELAKKEGEIAAKERAIQSSFNSLTKAEDAIRTREAEAARRETNLAEKQAGEEAKVREEKDRLTNERERLTALSVQIQADGKAIAARQKELDGLILTARQREQAVAQARRKAEEYKNSEAAKRAERRKADLDRLARSALDLAMEINPKLIRSRAQRSIADTLSKPLFFDNWGMEHEDEFADAAVQQCRIAIGSALGGHGGFQTPEEERFSKEAFEKASPLLEKWKKEYLGVHKTNDDK